MHKTLRLLHLHSVGFEPTSTNTFELESNPLDRSGMNAYLYSYTDSLYPFAFWKLPKTNIFLSIFLFNHQNQSSSITLPTLFHIYQRRAFLITPTTSNKYYTNKRNEIFSKYTVNSQVRQTSFSLYMHYKTPYETFCLSALVYLV